MGMFDWLSSEKKDELEVEVSSPPRESDFSEFHRVTEYIYEESGITDLDKRALTASRLQSYAVESDVYTTPEFLHAMQHNKIFYQEVMNIATINESFFLREKRELEWLVSHVQESGKKFDILVLPCSTGEEVYSILLMLSQKNISLENINITGYDLNSQAIINAKKAIYDEHSLHNVDAQTRAEYFEENEQGLYEVKGRLKSKPQFIQENIFEIECQKKQYDIVLSRNMFIYFDDAHRATALEIIVKLLKPNGIYIKGHADNISKHEKLTNIAYGIYSKQI